VSLHGPGVAGPSFTARRGAPAVDMHDPPVPEADEMVDRHTNAALVINTTDGAARAAVLHP